MPVEPTVTTSVICDRQALARFRFLADVCHGVSAGERIRQLIAEDTRRMERQLAQREAVAAA